MTTSRHRWLAHLLPSLKFFIIALGVLHIIAAPGPASAAPPSGQARAAAPQVGAEGGENPVNKSNYGHDHSRSAVPSVMREYPKPPKKGDPLVTMGGQPPTFRKSPRITMPKRFSRQAPMQETSPGAPAVSSDLR